MKRNLIMIVLGFLLGIIFRDFLNIPIGSWKFSIVALLSGILVSTISSKIERNRE